MPMKSIEIDDPADQLTVMWFLLATQTMVTNHLKDPAKLPEWLGRSAVFDLRIGGEVIVDHDDGYLCRSEVLSASRGDESLAVDLSWEFPDEPRSRLSLRTANLTDEPMTDGLTALTLEHSDLGTLKKSYAAGWLTHLTYFEASLSGTPLPSHEFWNICATFEKLMEDTLNSN